MQLPVLVISALVLAIERVAYASIWRRPDGFAHLCRRLAPRRDPVDVLSGMFVAFKVVQAGVFVVWCVAHGGGLTPATDSLSPLGVGGALIVVGQTLNLSVFARLGRTGVFYGTRLGHDVPWCRGFPFSLVRHPQYVGTALSIWGLFIAMRWPASDWAALPILESVYYAAGAVAEQAPVSDPIIPSLGQSATAGAPPASRRLS